MTVLAVASQLERALGRVNSTFFLLLSRRLAIVAPEMIQLLAMPIIAVLQRDRNFFLIPYLRECTDVGCLYSD